MLKDGDKMNWLWYILIYSFLGFLLEICYARGIGAEKQDRKCLLVLPLCPVYGLGALGILSLPEGIVTRPWLLMPTAIVVATVTEYGMGWFYERFWHVSFWDYRNLPWNVHGRVCLLFSLAWGLLSLPLVYWVHPLVMVMVQGLPEPLLAGLVTGFLADWFISGYLLRRTGETEVLRWYSGA